ncbi:hypothetical protein ACA910_002273 [Epithemia clementina (nom. ined.)]
MRRTRWCRSLELASLAVFAVALWTTVKIDVPQEALLSAFPSMPMVQETVAATRSTSTTTAAFAHSTLEAAKEQWRQILEEQEAADSRGDDFIPLQELVDTKPEQECPPGLVMIRDVRNHDLNVTNKSKIKPRRIPRIIHMTSKSRCATQNVANFVDTWKQFPDHEFYFHNDAAMKRLIFEKKWPEFPQLHLALDCSNVMVELVDLWRALVVWEYGGIYTDMDNLPRKRFDPSTTLKSDDQAFFEVERGRWLSQYFFAAEPKHPIMYMLVLKVWERLFNLQDVAIQYAPYITGPGALKEAMKLFMQTHQMPVNKSDPFLVFEKVKRGTYVGLHNRTITVGRMSSAVFRNVIGKKTEEYSAMNMTGYQSRKKPIPSNISCFAHLYLSQQKKKIGKEQGHKIDLPPLSNASANAK